MIRFYKLIFFVSRNQHTYCDTDTVIIDNSNFKLHASLFINTAVTTHLY